MCDNTMKETESVLESYAELKDEQDFRAQRLKLVLNTLEEFNEMKPANLECLFQYKTSAYEDQDHEKVEVVSKLLQGFKEKPRRI